MPTQLMTIKVETADLLGALETLTPDMQAATKAAAAITADNIVREAQGRVARRTGQTAEGIHKEESHDGTGYVVLAANRRMPMLPYWLEYGTKVLKAREFFFVSAALESERHKARIAEAVDESITAAGLGG